MKVVSFEKLKSDWNQTWLIQYGTHCVFMKPKVIYQGPRSSKGRDKRDKNDKFWGAFHLKTFLYCPPLLTPNFEVLSPLKLFYCPPLLTPPWKYDGKWCWGYQLTLIGQSGFYIWDCIMDHWDSIQCHLIFVG